MIKSMIKYSVTLCLFSMVIFSCKKDKDLSPQEICNQSTEKTQQAYDAFLNNSTNENCTSMKMELTNALANCLTLDNEEIKSLAELINQFDCDAILCSGLVGSIDSLIQNQIDNPSPENCNLARDNAKKILADCSDLPQEIEELINSFFFGLNCEIDVVACAAAAQSFQEAQEAYLANADSMNCATLKEALSNTITACGDSISPEIEQVILIISALDCDPNSNCNLSLNDLISAFRDFEINKNEANCDAAKNALNDVITFCGGSIAELLTPVKEQLDKINCSDL